MRPRCRQCSLISCLTDSESDFQALVEADHEQAALDADVVYDGAALAWIGASELQRGRCSCREEREFLCYISHVRRAFPGDVERELLHDLPVDEGLSRLGQRP